MNIHILSIVLILTGAGFMLVSIFHSGKIRREVPVDLRGRWLLITCMMVFFVVGYISFVFILISDLRLPAEILTATIFIGGALYVFTVINISKTTINKITRSENIIKEKNRELSEQNLEMEREIDGRIKAEYKLKEKADELERVNVEISERQMRMQMAMNKLSSLMESVIQHKHIDVMFENTDLRKCYEIKGCSNEDCRCYGTGPLRCWEIAGTLCGGEVQGKFAQKYNSCRACDVYKMATSGYTHEMGEHFNSMMHVLRHKHEELEHTYQELSETQAKFLQQEKMASIGQISAGVAHEINNPSGFVSSNLQSLRKYTEKITDFISAQDKAIEHVNSEEIAAELNGLRKKLKIDYILGDLTGIIDESLDGMERIKKIVQNLKSFARLDDKDQKSSDINECIESTLNIVWNEIKYKAAVEKEYGDIPKTMCYPGQLNQVFMNLLVNASHAIEKQGVIRIRTWNNEGTIKVSISDTGSGIPEDKIIKIFEPFFTTKEAGKGTGLGLSICNDIVKKHNGEITVDSKVGQGTTFTVKIPVVGEAICQRI